MATINMVVRIALSGSTSGLLTTNPRRVLDQRIDKENQEGWTVTSFFPHSETNDRRPPGALAITRTASHR